MTRKKSVCRYSFPVRQILFFGGILYVFLSPAVPWAELLGKPQLSLGAGNGTFETTSTEHSTPIEAIAISADGRLLASAGEGVKIFLQDIHSQSTLYRLSAPSHNIVFLTFSHDGGFLASGGWDLRSGDHRRSLPHRLGDTGALAFSLNSSKLVSSGEDGTLRVGDLDTGSEVNGLANFTAVSLALSPDGHLVGAGAQ